MLWSMARGISAHFPCVVAAWLCLPALAGPCLAIAALPDPRPAASPFASFRLGDAAVEFDRGGGFVLRRGGQVLVAGAELVVALPGWTDSAGQSGARPAVGWPRRGAGRAEWRADLWEPGTGVRWRLAQSVRQESGTLRFRYEAVPAADTSCGEVSLFLDLPLATWSGRPGALWPTAPFTFPPDRPGRPASA